MVIGFGFAGAAAFILQVTPDRRPEMKLIFPRPSRLNDAAAFQGASPAFSQTQNAGQFSERYQDVARNRRHWTPSSFSGSAGLLTVAGTWHPFPPAIRKPARTTFWENSSSLAAAPRSARSRVSRISSAVLMQSAGRSHSKATKARYLLKTPGDSNARKNSRENSRSASATASAWRVHHLRSTGPRLRDQP